MGDIKLSVIGCGYWGKNHIRTLSEMGAMYAVHDANSDHARQIADQFGCLALDEKDILASESDGIVIATPAVTHAQWVRQVLEHDKHVLVEKPLCLDVKEGEALLALARDKNRLLMVGHLLRYHTGFKAVEAYVAAGKLGRLFYIKSNRLSHGKFRTEEDVWWSFAPHDISMVLALLKETPTDVNVIQGSYLQPDIRDKADAYFCFKSGVDVSIHVNWLSPYKEHRLTVVGEKGMLVFDDTQEWGSKVALYQTPVVWEGDTPIANKYESEYIQVNPCEPLKEQAKHFIDCIEKKNDPVTNGEEGLAVLNILNSKH